MLTRYSDSLAKSRNSKKKKSNAVKRCPVCKSQLYEGEKVMSQVYRTGKTEEICHINGCPHCFPQAEPLIKRICPVCSKNIPANGFLISKMFLKDGKMDHVHIMGCSECYRR
ncbi:MAG: hypothetical protein K5839_00980 [Treponemataceae bacterium]|nr:hypothetical protein [Treponemataceae bacterium]